MIKSIDKIIWESQLIKIIWRFKIIQGKSFDKFFDKHQLRNQLIKPMTMMNDDNDENDEWWQYEWWQWWIKTMMN